MKHIGYNSFFKAANQAVPLLMGNCKLTHKFDGEMLFWDAQEETQTRNSTPATNPGNKLLTHGSSKHKWGGGGWWFKTHVSCCRGLLLVQSFFASVLASYIRCNLLVANITLDSVSEAHLERGSVTPTPRLSRARNATEFSPCFDMISDNSL